MKHLIFLTTLLLLAACSRNTQPRSTTPSSAQSPKPQTYNTQDKSAKSGTEGAEGTESAYNDYIEQYKDVAIAEMDRTGIPASIKLGQAILESGGGQSDLAKTANNHFGVKCASGWNGKTYEKKDDEKDANGELKESCFRKYSKPEESFFDHSEFLRDPRKYYRYGSLFGLDKTDYRAWARGLETAGYATAPGYADKLIGVIERNKLYQYDNPATQSATRKKNDDTTRPGEPTKEASGRVSRVNDVKVVLSKEGETVDDIARLFRLSPTKVADYNERRYTPGQSIKSGTRVYIQPKKSKWRGRVTHHFVRENQSMFEISQQYGVQLNDLLKRNGMQAGQEAATGERVRIKGNRKADEIVRLRDTPLPSEKPNAGNTPSTTSTKPNKPATTPTKDEELFEIGGNTPSTPPATTPTKPTTTTPTTTTPPNTGKPATSSGTVNYPPSDPVPVNEPVATAPGKPTPSPVTPAPAAQGVYHTVVKGDTLFSLQRKYGTPVAKIKSMNGLTADQINIGQRIRVQ